jgi:DNA polymerase-3 subunit alpha
VELEECRRMGIVVNPPDINKSHVGFTTEIEKKSMEGKAIRFGLSAIKNVGEAAIGEILKAREKGEFKSLTDFCKKVDSQKVNKKVLESLIQVGAMDKFGKRAALLFSLDKIRSSIEEDAKKKANGQSSLFDNLEENEEETDDTNDHLPEIEELTNTQLLSLEKSLLGFYLSETPFSESLKKLNLHITQKITDFTQNSHGEKVVLGGVITATKKVYTKRGNNEMAFFTLENSGEKLEIVVFPKLYPLVKEILINDKVVVVKGKIDWREDKLSVLADSIEEFSESKHASDDKNFIIRVSAKTPKEKLHKINGLLLKHKGKDRVTIVLTQGLSELKRIPLPYTVRYSPELLEDINDILTS